MELASPSDTVGIDNERVAENTAAVFAGKLMSTALAGKAGKKCDVSVNMTECIRKPGPGIKTITPVRVAIDRRDVQETADRVEYTLFGSVVNGERQNEKFTLYFFIRRNRLAIHEAGDFSGKVPATSPLSIQFETAGGRLTDSVFEMDLFQLNKNGRRHVWGQGRGALFFGCET